ncbi:MAG: DUF1499 domain-containing protein [bacterium]
MNETTASGRKWWASALLVGAVIGLVCLPVGALGAKLGIWGFMGGFTLLAVGTVLAAAVFFLGIIALVVSFSKKLPAERSAVSIGLVISVVILVLMGSQFMTAQSVPAIHNISTDTEDPPEFDAIVALRGPDSNPLAYDAQALAAVQRQAYPQVQSLITEVAPGEMLNRAVAVLEDMGLEIVDTNAAAGRVEATDTTFWFGFKDDVVVRIRPQGSGSIVDVRSVSRVGQSDLGKNAERISEFLAGLKAI